MVSRIATLLLLVIALNAGWEQGAQAQEFSGVWRGKWTSHPAPGRRPHQGSLRVRLTPTAPCTYQGTFTGRFAVVLPYFYRAEVQQVGDTLISKKKLFGSLEYQMQVRPQGSSVLSGGWQAADHSGNIFLRKRSP